MATDQVQGFEQSVPKAYGCETFLTKMEEFVPWAALCETIEPHCSF